MNAQPNLGMQVTTFENPMGVDGFEFVEFAAPDPALLHELFRKLGFSAIAKHRTKQITLYRQGACNFLVNEEPDSFAADFAKTHGPSACGFAIRFRNPSDDTLRRVLANGAEEITHKSATKAVDVPVIKGIGGCMLYLVDRYGDKGDLYAQEFDYLPSVDRHPRGFGLTFINHPPASFTPISGTGTVSTRTSLTPR